MFCQKCGNEIVAGSAFCGNCGNPISSQDAGSTQPIQGDQVSDDGAAENLSEGIAPAKKKKKSKIVVPVVAVFLVAAIGVAAAFATDGFGLLGDPDAESIGNTETSYDTEESSAGTEVDSSEESIGGSEEAEDTEPDENDDGIKSSLEEYTWEELSAISAEIATASNENEAIEIAKKYNLVNEDGTLDGTQTKTVMLSDRSLTSVQIAGFLHDDKSDGSGKAGITFIFTKPISRGTMNSVVAKAGGWEASDMRSWLASEGKELLPEELQDVIVAVNKSTNNVGYVEENEDASSVVTITSDELWLFSLVELAGEVDESDLHDWRQYTAAILNAEGSQYKLFSDCGVDFGGSNDALIKTYLGDSCHWWQRSPRSDRYSSFMDVNFDGNPDCYTKAYLSRAVVPGFCI